MSNLSEKPARSEPAERERDSPEFSLEQFSPKQFSPEQRKFLLAVAHEAIAAKIAGKARTGVGTWKPGSPNLKSPSLGSPNTGSPKLAALEQPRGVFTTLYLRGELRGCVGYAAAVRPLAQAVAETACAAAFEDSRFDPVSAEEALELKISLSALSPLFPIDAARVEVGRHGLVVSEASISGTARRGLLLPQVPVEHGWDRETFLEQTCRKAGLPIDAWKDKSVVIEAFTAEVFGDDETAE